MKNNNKKLKAQLQALNNQLKAKGVNISEKKETIKDNVDINNLIKKDLIKSILLIILAFLLVIGIKILNPNLSLNKFF